MDTKRGNENVIYNWKSFRYRACHRFVQPRRPGHTAVCTAWQRIYPGLLPVVTKIYWLLCIPMRLHARVRQLSALVWNYILTRQTAVGLQKEMNQKGFQCRHTRFSTHQTTKKNTTTKTSLKPLLSFPDISTSFLRFASDMHGILKTARFTRGVNYPHLKKQASSPQALFFPAYPGDILCHVCKRDPVARQATPVFHR